MNTRPTRPTTRPLSTPTAPDAGRPGFTLIEILVVVVILGILAAVVIPQFTNASDDANDAVVRTQLNTIRGQIVLSRAKVGEDPELGESDQWDDLIINDYLHNEPINPLNQSSRIEEEPGDGVGWVWRDSDWGDDEVKQVYATDETGLAEYPE